MKENSPYYQSSSDRASDCLFLILQVCAMMPPTTSCGRAPATGWTSGTTLAWGPHNTWSTRWEWDPSWNLSQKVGPALCPLCMHQFLTSLPLPAKPTSDVGNLILSFPEEFGKFKIFLCVFKMLSLWDSSYAQTLAEKEKKPFLLWSDEEFVQSIWFQSCQLRCCCFKSAATWFGANSGWRMLAQDFLF